MKKFFTLTLGLAVCASLNAESIKVLTLGTGSPELEPAFMGLSISPNGKYACGSLDNGNGYFITDLENDVYMYAPTDDPEGAELRHVDNNGLAIGYNGPGITYNMEGVETVIPVPDGDYRYVLGEDLSDDGSVKVGSLVGKSYDTYAAYSKDNGEWTLLPMPSDELLGKYADTGSAAKYVSGDGSIILGYIGSFGPAILWKLNDAGEYEIVPLFDKYVILSEDEEANEGKELYGMFAMGLSNNGTYAVFRGMILVDNVPQFVPVTYNTVTDELTIYAQHQEIDAFDLGLTPCAIDDNGTIIGVVGEPLQRSSGCFILEKDATQAVSFLDAFPEFTEKFGFADSIGYIVPTGMSADGNEIIGYGFYSEDFEDEESPAYFVTFVITKEDKDNSVIGISEENAGNVQTPVIYNLQGQRINNLNNGVNIVRMPDGKVNKVIK